MDGLILGYGIIREHDASAIFRVEGLRLGFTDLYASIGGVFGAETVTFKIGVL